MKQTNFFRRVLPLLTLLVFSVSSAWAAEGDLYHTCSMSNYQSGTKVTDYTKTSSLVISKNTPSVTWTCSGNQQSTQFRFGGKSINNADRGVTSTTAMGAPISKVSVEHVGVSSSSLKVNSITLTVSSTEDFSDIVYTNTIVPTQNQKVIAPSPIEWTGTWAAGLYYKIMVNVTNTTSSNYYFGVDAIKFYEGASSTDPAINASNNVTIDADATSGEIAYTISNPADGVNPTAAITTGDWISNVQVNTSTKKVTFDATENTGNTDRTATITISYTGAEDKVVTITQKKPIVMVAYNKVAASEMVIGGTYIWCAEKNGDGQVITPVGSNTYFNATSFGSYTAGAANVSISSEIGIQSFIFYRVNDGWVIENPDATNANKYMAVTGGNQTGWKDGPSPWTLKGSDNPIVSRGDSTMQFNLNNPRFNVYKSSQTAAYLYHLASESAHTLSLNPNYGEEEAVDYLVKDGFAWLPVAPSRSGFEFIGWATTAEGEVAYNTTASYTMPTTNSELFAVWEAISADPELTTSVNSVDVASEKLATGTATFTISGSYLTSNLSLEFAEAVTGLSVSPASITISNPTLAATTITVSYVNTEAASGAATLNIMHGDDVLASVTVNYTSTAALTEIVPVSTATTWDFSGYTTDVTPDRTVEVIFSNVAEFKAGFNADALKGEQQYIVRNNFCWQGTKLVFHPAVAGTVTVVWSSTSGSNKRTLAIGDEKIVPAGSTSTSASGGVTTTRAVVADQDVVLTGWNVESDGSFTSNQVRIWSITFKPYPTLAFANAEYNATMGQAFETPVLTASNGVTVTYSSDNTEVADVNATTGAVILNGVGDATITATFAGNASYAAAEASYVLHVKAAAAANGTLNFVATNEDGYWATFSSTEDVIFDANDVVVYTVAADGNALVMIDAYDNSLSCVTDKTKDGGWVAGYYVQAGVGVLINSLEESVNYYFIDTDPYTANDLNEIETDPEYNMLRAASVEKETDGSYKFYKLAYASSAKDALGFYWGAAEGGVFASREGSAYLAVPAEIQAPVRFVFNNTDQATAVENVDASVGSATGLYKFLENGQVIILRDGVRYNAVGQIVK